MQTASVPIPIEGATVPPTDIPIPPPIPASDSGVSDVDLRGAIQMLAQIVASQAQRSNVTPTSSSQSGDSTSSRFELWEESREEGSPPARWGEFADGFIDHFLPAETKASRAAEFENLRHGSLSVWDYHMRFAYLSKYAICMLPTMEARVHRFVQCLSLLVINKAAAAALNSYMNYGNMVAFTQATETRKLRNKIEREGINKALSAGNFGGSSGGGRSTFRGGSLGPSQSFAQSSASAPPSGPSQH
ncbi:uncharacterized protein [Nicotiana tomentosiformis]|uniref:uncharacterized protein n=1 Tax=Nicotiana tomentosiformis TaxID=4098 RepID=UPI00388C5C0A